MRKLVLALLVIVSTRQAARAESIGLGLFLGEPTGIDLKLGLSGRGALDIVVGETDIRRDRDLSYAHVTYLYLLTNIHGQSVNVPLRLGFGGYIAGITEDNATSFGARVPFELGIRFRRTPIEIYGEIAFVLRLFQDGNGNDDDIDTDIDGGIGLRVYF